MGRKRTVTRSAGPYDDTDDLGATADVARRGRARTGSELDDAAVSRATHHAELSMLPGSTWARRVDARLEAVEKRTTRRPARRLLLTALKAIGIGGGVTALLLAARALVAHGDASAADREQAELVRRHEMEIRLLQQQQAADDEAHGRRNRE